MKSFKMNAHLSIFSHQHFAFSLNPQRINIKSFYINHFSNTPIQNTTISHVFPFLKNTPAQNLPAPHFVSNQEVKRLTRQNAHETCIEIVKQWDKHLNKITKFHGGSREFVMLSEHIVWVILERNVAKFDFTQHIHNEITHLNAIFPQDLDVQVIVTISFRCETHLEKSTYEANEQIYRPPSKGKKAVINSLQVPNHMTIVIYTNELLSKPDVISLDTLFTT